MPSVLWGYRLGSRKGIQPVEKQGDGVLVWLSVWSKVQTCIWPSWCHCHSLSLASVKSRLVLPFWYRLTWVVPDKGTLNGCVYLLSMRNNRTSTNVLRLCFNKLTGRQMADWLTDGGFKSQKYKLNLYKNTKSNLNLTNLRSAHICVHTTVNNTTQHWAVLIIFHLYL